MPLDVRVIGPEERDTRTAQTPGLRRFAAICADKTGSSELWMGYAVLEPGGKTGVHHHGESETAIFVISGVTRWWVGEELDDVREAHAGDFVFIPPGIVHWEQNASETEPVEMIVARSTQEAIVVAVEGHPHRPAHAS
ncbi:Cupin domain-containing protein [Klenkia soli]|uniref:Cupin domain-containing protein n=1 Tax=Klenkia soli TaxID=1052260 RepID=A0A1H0SIJ7_9ACTN|nr:cupin domain-containing protein [Klenkia soli]SDP41642.1 Cupin domain-containing protein [Klenkia soli]